MQWFELVQKPEEIDSIFVKSDYKLVQIDLKKITYIEGLKDYIKIYTEDAPKPILSLMSMKAMEELLPSSRFIRVHRSFIVQKDKIRVIDRGRIVLTRHIFLSVIVTSKFSRLFLMKGANVGYFIGEIKIFVDNYLSKPVLSLPLQRTERDCEIPRIE